jgi:hypothetical protein
MTFRFLRFLLHVEHPHLVVNDDDARALELFYRGLLMTHDARGLFLLGKVNELLEREEQDVVSSNDEYIIVDTAFLHRQQQVTDSTQTGIVGLRAIVNDSDGLFIVLFLRPVLKDVGKFVIGDDDVFVNVWDAVDVVEHASKDGALANLQQGLGEILGELAQTSGIAGSYYDCFHCFFGFELQ